MSDKPKVLAVDDEEFNLDIMTDYLTDDGYEVIGAEDGLIALDKLKEHNDISVIVLDRMMPNLDGMSVLKQIKQDDALKDIPVIMQTAAASSEQVLEGINAGVYYYLTKPYEDVMLLSIVQAAISEAKNKHEMRAEVQQHRRVSNLMDSSQFHFQTLEEAKSLAYFIANCFPEPDNAVYGLNELFINAVEHGNLGITYAEKTNLVLSGNWHEEVQKRLASPEYKDKKATLIFEATEESITIHLKDEGVGFDWEKYLEISADRATDPHGRGIATSSMMSFDKIQYLGNGNEVTCIVNL